MVLDFRLWENEKWSEFILWILKNDPMLIIFLKDFIYFFENSCHFFMIKS
jgi:hypothetical protein